MEIELEFLKDFYQNSWSVLILAVSGAFVVIGIIMPIILQIWQNIINKDKYETLAKHVDDFLATKCKELDIKMKQIEEKSKIVDGKLDSIEKNEDFLTGNILYFQATSFATKDLFMLLMGLLNAFQCFIKANRIDSLSMVYLSITQLVDTSGKINIPNITFLQNQTLKETYETVLNLLQTNNKDGNLSIYLSTFERLKAALL